jgi:hypothetical protein
MICCLGYFSSPPNVKDVVTAPKKLELAFILNSAYSQLGTALSGKVEDVGVGVTDPVTVGVGNRFISGVGVTPLTTGVEVDVGVTGRPPISLVGVGVYEGTGV